MSELIWLDDALWFPKPELALTDPDGLLAVGGDLSPERLAFAYAKGIFPWFEARQPILWWSPSVRCLIDHQHLHISRSLRKLLKRQNYEVRVNVNFQQVIEHCAAPRSYSDGTWITTQMQTAYSALHDHGVAHSVEVYFDSALAGGLYGISLGKCFFGESMFSLKPNASKIAFVHLVRTLSEAGYGLIDCQLDNPHLKSLGCYTVPRDRFLTILDQEVNKPYLKSLWHANNRLLFDW